MTTRDYRFMLVSAKEHLDELPSLYNACLKADEVPKRLTNKIRYLLTDIESALDYIAFAIFNQYCLKHITDHSKIESAQKRVNFPLFDDKPYFDKKIDKMFLELRSERPDIIEIIERRQPFVINDSEHWLPIFNKLVNNNKHRELEKQKISSTSNIAYMNDAFGNQFINCTFSENGTDIMYGNTPINFRNYQSNPYIKSLNVTVTVNFSFKGLNLEVLPTLSKIYDGANSVINELENAMEGN